MVDPISLNILKTVGIELGKDESTNNGNIIIVRDLLLNDELYDTIKPLIMDLKHIIGSTKHTCLHKDADSSQRWPLINLVRQILHYYGYKMEPFRKCVTKNGVKVYTRYFRILATHSHTHTHL